MVLHRGVDTQASSGVGSFVREHRRAAGLTQRQLAAAAQVSIGVIRDLEQGLRARDKIT